MTTAFEVAPDLSIAAARRRMAKAFAAAGIDTPDLDARLLLAAALGLDSAALVLLGDERVGAKSALLSQMASRRLDRQPVSRILGWREFYGRRFEVTPATLDPRPDSETVIDAVLAWIRANGGIDRHWRILDVGTGTGCLLLTLLAELPNASGLGSDISGEALAVAARNAGNLGLGPRARLLEADGVEDLVRDGQVFDVLVSNPPYIPSRDIAGLAPEVRQYDPRLALDGGADGLTFYRRLIEVSDALVPDGFVCFEIGHDQGGAIEALIRQACWSGLGWPPPQLVNDLAGHTRCVTQTTRR